MKQKILSKIGVLALFVLCAHFASAQAPDADFTFSNPRCTDQEISFTDNSTTPVGSITRWHWNFGDAGFDDTSNVQNPTYVYSMAGLYAVNLYVWNTAGEIDSSFLLVNVYPTPVAAMDIEVPCFPSSINLTDVSTVSSGSIASNIWTIEGAVFPNSNMLNHNFGSEGRKKVSILVTSSDNCEDTLTEFIYQGSLPDVVISPSGPISICEGNTADLFASGANNYVWRTGETIDSITVSTSNTYLVTGFNGNMCFDSDSITVNVLPSPTADAGEDVTIGLGESTSLDGSGAGNFSWSPATALSDANIANPIANPNTTTTYVLTVIGSNGCFNTDTVTITVEAGASYPVHNMITPNNDGANDVWDLSSVPGYESANISVFNRWGWEVFKSTNYQNDWAGTMNGDPLSDGTYIYVIQFDDGREPLRGNLEILRNTRK